MIPRIIYGSEDEPVDSDQLHALLDQAYASNLYFEFNGGLGDIVIQSSQSNVFAKLNSMQKLDRAVIVLFSHNPFAWELFGFHPNSGRVTVLMLGFSDYRDEAYRKKYGLKSHVDTTVYLGGKPWAPPISTDDERYLKTLPKKFITLSLTASAGPSDRRSIPRGIAVDLVSACLEANVAPVVLGRHYPYVMMKDTTPGFAHKEEAEIPGSIWAVNCLSAAGSVEALRRSVLNVACESAMIVASWIMRRPTYFLCSRAMWEMFPKNIAILGQGYHFGTLYPENRNEMFEDHSRERFLSYLSEKLYA